MSGFASLQATFAKHRIATYPLKADKTPAVSGYGRIGAPYSAVLATKFPDTPAAGFVAGVRNRITVIDIDSPDDRLVDEIQGRYGVTPLQVLTPSGGRHLYYRHGGECRSIKPFQSVDILGAGNVVAALSVVTKGRYQLERGTLDDLARLPSLLPQARPSQSHTSVPRGRRNNTLLEHCRSITCYCDSLDQLIDAARTWSEGLSEPLPNAEVVKTAGSAWHFRGGRKRIMQQLVEGPKYAALIANTEALALFAYLSAENGPDATFMVADGLAVARGWPRRFVPAARKALVEIGVMRCVQPSRKGAAALYRWTGPIDE